MTRSQKSKLLMWNTIMWITAMVLPGVFSIAFASTKFPWPIVMPLLLLGFLINSNSVLSKAIGEPTDDPVTGKTTGTQG